jgi:signal transduction histidine kinase/CheY-like chemotaxis protein
MILHQFRNRWLWQYFENLETMLRKSIKISQSRDFQYWRERLFLTVFITVAVCGFFVYIPSVILAFKINHLGVVAIDTLVYIAILISIIFRRIPFGLRSGVGVTIFYLLGVFILIINGPISAGYIWLFSFPILTGAFLGTSSALIALFINMSTLSLIAILLHMDYFRWDSLPSYNVAVWIVTGINFIFLNSIVTISFTSLFNGLRRTLEKELVVSAKLNQEHHRVLETVKHLNLEIHERKKAEEEKIKLERQLQQAQKMESIGTLAGGIAHDFNNILYPIIGFTELTLAEIPKDSLAYRNLNEVHIASKRAKSLVQQILRFSRMDAPGFEPIKIQEVIHESLGLLRASIPSTIEINKNIDNECGPIKGDPTQIHQVIVNLCTNAYQAMEGTPGRLNISLRIYDKTTENDFEDIKLTYERYAMLTIQDTGPGIASDVMEKIFDPYFTTKELGKGTGLGLSVVHGIVKNHGGNILVQSEPGKGTVFHIFLPIMKEDMETGEIDLADILARGNERLLVVDDEEAILALVKQMLERLGYYVDIRSSSLEALSLFRFKPEQYDLVITDMTMPVMTGLKLAKRLRKINKAIPIILCTGFSEGVSEEKMKAVGIDGFIMKPIVQAELAKLIRSILDNNKLKKSEVPNKAIG